jgi:uncharacterized membrane protein YccC
MRRVVREKKSVFLGTRFSKAEMEWINSTRGVLKLNKSEMIRHLVQQAISAEQSQISEREKEIRELRRRLHSIHQVTRYVAALLTALVRKSSKSNPEEAERMIALARAEAEKEYGIS